MSAKSAPDLILHNGRITTLDPKYPETKNIAIKDGRIVGVDDAESYERGPNINLSVDAFAYLIARLGLQCPPAPRATSIVGAFLLLR
jgi:N-acyl-D-aspartate/D-glutamate deacylase